MSSGFRFAIAVSRFNEEITEGLLRGAREALADAGAVDTEVLVVHVPGAFELPLVSLELARTRKYDAVIALGCLIKGDTMHFEYIADAASHALMDAAMTTGVPVSFGLLTTLTDEQAEVRAAAGPGNKGREAALAAVEMATLLRQIRAGTS